MKKSELLALVAADEIAPALELCGRSAEALKQEDTAEEILLLRSQWEGLDKEERANTRPKTDLALDRNKVKRALIALAMKLPEDLPIATEGSKSAAAAPKTGVSEERFKRQIFFFMLAAKCWIVYWIVFHKNSGGFSSGEALATISLLLPAFTAYTTVMLSDFIRHRRKPELPKGFEPRVSRTLQRISWIVFPVYVLALHSIIGSKAAGTLADEAQANYESMTAWLAIVESAFGIYVGQIIHEVFKSDD
jgi:Effector-associated domain 11